MSFPPEPESIFAVVVGLDGENPYVGAYIDLHQTVATLLNMFEKRLVSDFCLPCGITAAYSIEHTRKGGIDDDDDPDYIGLCKGDPEVVQRFLTPAARLDPTKRVDEYFGGRATDDVYAVALTVPPAALEKAKQRRDQELANVPAPELWIQAVIVGLGCKKSVVSAFPKGDEPVATLIDLLEEQLVSEFRLPYQITAAYSIEHTRKGGIEDEYDPDYIGLCEADAHIVTRYLTPAARLDPTKRVDEYFGGRANEDAYAVGITLPLAALAEFKRRLELDRERRRAKQLADEEATWAQLQLPLQTSALVPMDSPVTPTPARHLTNTDADPRPAASASTWQHVTRWFSSPTWSSLSNFNESKKND